MKISDETLGCLGAILLLVVVLLSQGLIVWCIVNGFCWIFKIGFHLSFLKSFVLGILISLAETVLFGSGKNGRE